MNVYFFLALFFIIIGILSYSFFIEPNCLVIHKNQIKVTESGKTLRIVQLSDIHLKKNYSVKALKQIVEKTNTLQPATYKEIRCETGSNLPVFFSTVKSAASKIVS